MWTKNFIIEFSDEGLRSSITLGVRIFPNPGTPTTVNPTLAAQGPDLVAHEIGTEFWICVLIGSNNRQYVGLYVC
jgi:hypothetical protein